MLYCVGFRFGFAFASRATSGTTLLIDASNSAESVDFKQFWRVRRVWHIRNWNIRVARAEFCSDDFFCRHIMFRILPKKVQGLDLHAIIIVNNIRIGILNIIVVIIAT